MTEEKNKQKDLEKKRTKCLVYSRCVGWLTSVKNWNKGKRAEWKERKEFKI